MKRLILLSCVLGAAVCFGGGKEPAQSGLVYKGARYSAVYTNGTLVIQTSAGAPLVSVSDFAFIGSTNGAAARAKVTDFKQDYWRRFTLACSCSGAPAGVVAKFTGEFKDQYVRLSATVWVPKTLPELKDRRAGVPFRFGVASASAVWSRFYETWRHDDRNDSMIREPQGDLFAVRGLAEPLTIRRRDGGWAVGDGNVSRSRMGEWSRTYTATYHLVPGKDAADVDMAAAISCERPRLDLETDAPMNVFGEGPIAFRVTGGNTMSEKPQKAKLTVVVRNYDRKVVFSNDYARAALAPDASFTERCELPAQAGREVYSVRATLRIDNRTSELASRLVRCPMPALARPANLGMVTHARLQNPAQEATLQRMLSAAGVKFLDGESGRGFEPIASMRVGVGEGAPDRKTFEKAAEAVVDDCARRGAGKLYLITDIHVSDRMPREQRKAAAAAQVEEFLARAKSVARLCRRNSEKTQLVLVTDDFEQILKAAPDAKMFQQIGIQWLQPWGCISGRLGWRGSQAQAFGLPLVWAGFDVPRRESADRAWKKTFPAECTLVPFLCTGRFVTPQATLVFDAHDGRPSRFGCGLVSDWDQRWWSQEDGLFEEPDAMGGCAKASLCAFATAAEYLDGSDDSVTVEAFADQWTALTWNTAAHGRVSLVLLHDIYNTFGGSISPLPAADARSIRFDHSRKFVFNATAPVVKVVDVIGRVTEYKPVGGKVTVELDERPAFVLGIDLTRYTPVKPEK